MFQTWSRLRRFAFDRHDLRIDHEDRTHTAADVFYDREPSPNTISIDALREVPSWSMPEPPRIKHVHESTFAFPMDAPHPQLVLVHIPVVRHSWFYLTRFFLPLLVLVATSYAIFWVRLDDLQSSSAIDITCILSIIAFQLAQSAPVLALAGGRALINDRGVRANATTRAAPARRRRPASSRTCRCGSASAGGASRAPPT